MDAELTGLIADDVVQLRDALTARKIPVEWAAQLIIAAIPAIIAYEGGVTLFDATDLEDGEVTDEEEDEERGRPGAGNGASGLSSWSRRLAHDPARDGTSGVKPRAARGPERGGPGETDMTRDWSGPQAP